MGALNARSTIRGWPAVAMVLAGAVVAFILLRAPAETASPPAEAPRPPVSPNAGYAWDADVRFELTRMDCHPGGIDEHPAAGRPGKHCVASLSILNESARDVLLPSTAHTLSAGGEEFTPWDEAMELARSNADAVFVAPIPPGGGGTAAVYFSLPEAVRPQRVEVHAAEGSPGATFVLDDCRFDRHEGVVSGSCYSEAGREVEVGEVAPHFIGRTGGELAPEYVCFDQREWTADPQPASQPLDFVGHGVIELVSEDRAVYTDNSGLVLPLGLTSSNDANPGTCG